MRNAVNNLLSNIQLSSPLPSPSRSLMNNSSTSDQTSSNSYLKLPPIMFSQPNSELTSDLYPLVNLETPSSMKKFNFMMHGKPNLFEEVQTIPVRKRSASWEDDRSHKRKELDTSDNTSTSTIVNNNAFSSFPASDSGLPDSPNSALPSPVSDLSPEEAWSPTSISKEEHTSIQSNFVDHFDTLPDSIQSYFLFQLLKRSPRHTLRLASDTILQALKTDVLAYLPSSITTQILGYLDTRSLCRATAVSKAWNDMIDHASEVWKQKMIESDFLPTPKEQEGNDYKQIVRRHTIMQRNWRRNRHQKILLEGHEDDLVTCLQFDDEKMITGSDDHSIHVYDIHTGGLQRVLQGHDGGVWALQYVGNTLVTGSIDRTVRVWNIQTGKCHFVLRGHSSTVRCLKIIMPSKITHPDGSVSMEPSEPIIVSGSRDMTIRVWKLPDIEDSAQALLSNTVGNDVASKHFLKFKLAEHEHSVRDLAVHGNVLVSGSYDNNVIVWNLETGAKVHTLQGHTMKVYCVAIDPKRRHCISGSLDASIRIWGLDDGECKYVLQGHAILVGLIGLVDDCLVSAAADSTVRVWDASNGDRLRILAGASGHQGPITSFQHDKYKIVSGSEGGVKMWNTQTGEFMYNLIEDVAGVWRVCFDERRCVAAVKNEHRTQLIVLDFGLHGLEND